MGLTRDAVDRLFGGSTGVEVRQPSVHAPGDPSNRTELTTPRGRAWQSFFWKGGTIAESCW